MSFERNIHDILDIISNISTQRDFNKLLDIFFRSVIKITNSNTGALYLYEDSQCTLFYEFNNTLNYYGKSFGEGVTPIYDEENLISLCLSEKKIFNIQDVNTNLNDCYQGINKKDIQNEYGVKSLLTVPIIGSEDTISGVLQLANATNHDGDIISYSKEAELIVSSLASLVAVSLSNIIYLQETKDLLYSIVSVTATAIDERSPYNANHTRNVARYIENFVEYLNEQYYLGLYDEYFDKNRKEQLVLSAHLHDIGKIVTPLNILNKSTRLGRRIDSISSRFKLIKSYIKIDFLQGKLTEAEYNHKIDYVNQAMETIHTINEISMLSEEHILFINELSSLEYNYEDENIKYINEIDKDCLLIPKGTLTDTEREIMKNHVIVTTKLLEKIHFSKYYKNVPIWASKHHEYLDGSGYPHQLSAEDLPTDVRILVIMDIFESLTSVDRPYKDPIPLEEAFAILDEMVLEEKIDGKLVGFLKNLYFK